MYSFSYLEPFCCSMSISNCCFLTCIQISQLTQVEGKNRLRNGTLILQLVKDGDDSSEGYVGVVQARRHQKVSQTRIPWRLDGTAGQYLQGPQSVWDKSFPLTDTWSGVRTGLGCTAFRYSEKNWGWALSLVAHRWLDQVHRGIWVPFERGCEF